MQSHSERGVSADDYQLMIEAVTDYAIYMLDPSGFILSWNAGAQALKGYTAEEIIGRHFSIFYPVELLDRNWTEHELNVAKETGRYEEESWRVRKDGSRFWASIVITKLVDKDGTFRGFCKITRDLTERRRQEDLLRSSEERFRLLVDGVSDYEIFMLDPAGFIVSWNKGAQKSKGYDAAEIIGKHFSIFYPEEVSATGWPNLELEKAKEFGRFEDEGWRVRKDGSRFWANVIITALYDSQNRHRGYSKITRDLTEKRRMTVLEAESRRIATFIAMLAHELRNPLAPITNALAIMNQLPNLDSDVVLARDIISRQSKQLNRLVDDLLDMSRITAGKLHLESKPVLMEAVIKDAIEMTNPLIQAQAHAVNLSLWPEPVWVSGDRTRLTQILCNLLHNAAKFTPRGGQIQVGLSVEDNTAVLSVSDNGPGIDPARLPRLFKRFEQSNADATKTHGGLGLGLSLVQELTLLHHGSVTGNSSGINGEGAHFRVELPRIASPSDSNHPQAPPSKTVLVVDDNHDAADTLVLLLSTMGYACKAAYFGKDAIEMAKHDRPSVVILDIGLPDIDGIAVASQIKAEIMDPPQLIALTGYGQDQDRERSFSAGFFAHLTKPVDPVKLRSMLQYLLA
ncbi:MAG TPA: PAS domain S-box protein [Dongiaceae bacterium]|nr:PAS domain S-box protein [Dongiaceae bacterium]